MTLNQLIIFILAIALSSMWCVGVHVVAVKLIIEEVLGRSIVEFWDRNSLPRWQKIIYKPMWACPACMASFWGSLIFWVVFPYMGVLFWVPFCVCLCGLNFFVSQFFVE